MFCILSHTVLDELQFHLYMPRLFRTERVNLKVPVANNLLYLKAIGIYEESMKEPLEVGVNTGEFRKLKNRSANPHRGLFSISREFFRFRIASPLKLIVR